ncbi:MAG: hypothetical protein ACHQII_07195, partial [Bacteroidia bacterium]
ALYLTLNELNISQNLLIQDIDIAQENTIEFLKFVDKEYHIYPIWICPIKPDVHVNFSSFLIKTELVMNVGIWGELKKDEQFYQANRKMEKMVEQLSGRKMLYAHAYYPKEEFWSIYDEQWYESLRNKYYAQNTFPNIFDKVIVSEEYKPKMAAWRILWGNLKSRRPYIQK